MNNLLSIQNLTIDFTKDGAPAPAVSDVSIDVQRGKLVAIVGESGSGKSVTALSVLQLLSSPPARYVQGRILFTDKEQKTTDLLKTSQKHLKYIRGNEISMIFQEPMTSLNPVYTCGDQVMEALVAHKKISKNEAKQKTLDLFENVKLPLPSAIFNRYPHQLSGGQKQRVMIAMAISCNPSLLLCDEPTTALDVTVQKEILQLVKNIQEQRNMGVIFISHDLGLVAQIADEVVVMYKGHIVEKGVPKEIYQNPKHPYTLGLLACRPALHQKGERLPVVSDFIASKVIGAGKKAPAGKEHSSENDFLLSDANANVKPLLSVKNVKVWFPGKRRLFEKSVTFTKAVDDVSFDVYEGETLGLVGESGCGKSTLGRCILQLIKPTEGEIYFKGEDLIRASKQRLRSLRKDIQIIFQDPYSSLNPRMTVGQAIGEPLEVHGLAQTKNERKDRVIQLLEKVNLPADHYYRYPHEFSGGQRQRIVIARALAVQPSFIICDESVSALDVSVQAQVLNLLNDLKREFKLTYIFISHDLSVVRYLSDRILVMNKGKIVETGNAEDIYLHPKSPYTQNLLASIPTGFASV